MSERWDYVGSWYRVPQRIGRSFVALWEIVSHAERDRTLLR
jgi:hypothetical protein